MTESSMTYYHSAGCEGFADRRLCECSVKDITVAWDDNMAPLGEHRPLPPGGARPRPERVNIPLTAVIPEPMKYSSGLHRRVPPVIRPLTPRERIATSIAPDTVELFVKKAADYGVHADDLGLKGQYSDIHRKIKKIRRSMWDGETLAFESLEEILMDLIGHCWLSIDMIRENDE